MRRFLVPLGLLVIAAFCQPADASKVKVWHHQTQAQFDKGKRKQAVVSSEGAVRLSRQVRALANVQAQNVWAIAEDKAGNIYAATGDEGKLYKITPEGKSTVAYSSTDSQILSLAQGPDGSIYAGTGPTGQIIKLLSDGNTRVLVNDLDSYVWSLVFDPVSQTLFAGTGPKGRIFQVNPEGKASVHYTAKQEHILCLALGPKNALYAGTDKGGLVYRIDAKGKGFVVCHANQSEVRSLLVASDSVYAGTSAPTARRPAGGKGEATPTSTENAVYRIAADGAVRDIFRDKVLMLSLAQSNGKLLVGTGMQGQLFEVDERTKERSEIARLDHGQILCLLDRRTGGFLLGAGDPGKLYTLDDKFAPFGTLTSEALDAKIISKWGSLSWKADTPGGTSVKVAVRSGNTAEPDDTWSDWSTEQTDPQESKILAPAARYLQYRVTLATENPKVTPEVRAISLRYKTTNQAPEITSLEVPDLDAGNAGNAGNADNAKKLKLRWTATDPNDDELTYRLYFRKDGWKEWVLLEDDLEKKDYEWDTTTVPSGTYQVKVVASDRKDNSPEEALTAERISAGFPVCHVPPTVTMKVAGMDGDKAILEASASSPLLRLTDASFAINGKRWTPIFPTDGLFDSKSESFRFKTDPLRPGIYVLMLRVRDAAGNTGAADVRFTVQERDK